MEITFQAIFSKASTLVDGGWRISFDVNPENADQILELAQCKDKLLQIAVVPFDPQNKGLSASPF